MGPARLKDLFRRQRMSRFEIVTCLGFIRIEVNQITAAAAFLSAGAFGFVRQEILKAGEKERAELAALAIRLRERLLFLQMETKSLHKIFRVLLTVTAPAHVSVKRIPIRLE